MDKLFTTEKGKYYKAELSEDGKSVIRIPVDITVTSKPSEKLDDLFFDYIDCLASDLGYLMAEFRPLLESNGYDLDTDNYIQLVCPYLPFRHYYHKKYKWTI